MRNMQASRASRVRRLASPTRATSRRMQPTGGPVHSLPWNGCPLPFCPARPPKPRLGVRRLVRVAGRGLGPASEEGK